MCCSPHVSGRNRSYRRPQVASTIRSSENIGWSPARRADPIATSIFVQIALVRSETAVELPCERDRRLFDCSQRSVAKSCSARADCILMRQPHCCQQPVPPGLGTCWLLVNGSAYAKSSSIARWKLCDCKFNADDTLL